MVSVLELTSLLIYKALEAAPDAMFIVDTQGIIRYSNLRTVELFGYPREELLGHAIEGLMPDEASSKHVEHRNKYFANPRIRPMGAELKLIGRRKDRTTFPIEVSLSPIEDAGRLLVAAAIRDITIHRSLEDQLSATARINDDLYNSAPCGYHSLDQDGTYLKINDTELAWLECQRADVIGKLSPRDFFSDAAKIQFQDVFRRFLQTGHIEGVEFELVSRNGRHRHVLLSATTAKDASGGFLMSREVMFDITDRRRLEDELKLARDSAIEANEVKSRFLAAASHDLRQPLQTIWSIQAFLSRAIGSAGLAPQLSLLEEAVRNMDYMLSELVDINRLERGAIQPVVRDFSLDEILPRLRSDFAYAAASKSILLDIEETSVFARSDPMLLPVILRNLLGNAIKYTQHGDVRLRVRPEGSDLCIDISDTGPGIDSRHLGHLFDAFYQINNPDRDQRRGVGLGLSIVQTVCRLLEHTVSVTSRVGEGSTFTVRMPAGVGIERKPAESPNAPIESSHAPVGDITVLHIEDDPGVAQSMALVLQLEGYAVISASSRDEALMHIRENRLRPDIILCDFNLPMGCTGDEIVAEIAISLGFKPLTIMLTGVIADRQLKKARQVAERILPKPVDVGLVLSAIRSLLEKPAPGAESPISRENNGTAISLMTG